MLTEFLVKVAAEATVVSTALAGVRRYAGFNLPRLMVGRINNDSARNLAHKYLDWGEFCWDKGAQVVRKATGSGKKQ